MNVFQRRQSVTSRPCWTRLKLAIVISGFSMASAGVPAWAQPTNNTNDEPSISQTSSNRLNIQYNPPPAPPDSGTPRGRKGGGGNRGECNRYRSIEALVPEHQERVWGLSASAHPTFWFYIPANDTDTADRAIEFVLQDSDDNYAYRTTRVLPPGPAQLLDISMPNTATPLTNNQPYLWTLILQCAPDNTNTYYISGTVYHVLPSAELTEQLKTGSPPERAALYSQAGYWYDTLTAVEDLHRNNREIPAYRDAWQHLLEQVELQPEAIESSHHASQVEE